MRVRASNRPPARSSRTHRCIAQSILGHQHRCQFYTRHTKRRKLERVYRRRLRRCLLCVCFVCERTVNEPLHGTNSATRILCLKAKQNQTRTERLVDCTHARRNTHATQQQARVAQKAIGRPRESCTNTHSIRMHIVKRATLTGRCAACIAVARHGKIAQRSRRHFLSNNRWITKKHFRATQSGMSSHNNAQHS